jgi:hypothetical protein
MYISNFDQFLGAFATTSCKNDFTMSDRLSRTTLEILMKFDIGEFY